VRVTTLLGDALPHTMILAVTSLALAILLGVPLGIYAATHANSWIDRVSSVVSISMITLPPYVAGLFLLLLFSVHFTWLPSIGAGSFSHPLDYLKHLALPAIALAVP